MPTLVGLVLAGSVAGCLPERRPVRGPSVGLALSWTAQQCRAPGRDLDLDGLDDDCELALARAFAPELVADARDCSWDASVRPARLGGGYLFAVGNAPDHRAIRAAYVPAYYEDCGWEGRVCVTRGPDCSAHDGDSELIVVQARYDAVGARWVTDAVFLSAHCFGRSAGRCRWYSGNELRYFAWADGIRHGAARVWVAKGKHANYPSRGECDTGHWYYDSCDSNLAVYRFPVISGAQNLGSRRRPLPDRESTAPAGCVSAEQLLWRSSTDPGTRECFWDPAAPFRGWQRRPRGKAPTPYARGLRLAAGF